MKYNIDFQINNGVLEKYTGTDTDVVVPDGVEIIGRQAFKNVEAMKSLRLPIGVTKIEDGAFILCGNLQNISFPETLTHIGDVAFAFCKKMEDIVLPNGVIHIGNNAFYACGRLRSITIPDSATDIGGRIFSEGMKIRKCVLVPHLQDEELTKNILNRLGKRFLALSFLLDYFETNQTLLKELEHRITAKKFREAFVPFLIAEKESSAVAKLLSLVKKMSLEEVDGYIQKSENAPEIRALFLEYKKQCYSVEEIEKIEEIQIEKEFGLREKTLADYRKDFKIFKDGDIYKITGYKSKNESVRIPGEIKGFPVQIGEKAFRGATCVREVYIEDGVTSLGNGAFCACYNLQSIVMPNSIKEIGDYAFFDCRNLQSFTVPDGVMRIGGHTFSGCSRLQNVEFSQNLTEIGEAAFFHCENLQNIVIPSHVTSIEHLAFSYCTNLKSITIPRTVTKISYSIFDGCKKLDTITYTGTQYEWLKFLDCDIYGNISEIASDVTINCIGEDGK